FLSEGDRFAEGSWTTATTGAPILADCLAWLDCTQYSKITAGTHTIYVGRVEDSAVPNPDDSPLVYWNRGYRTLRSRPSD
ncbi:MAG: flavin reductase family protein, partial [Acidobacteriota bacterium]